MPHKFSVRLTCRASDCWNQLAQRTNLLTPDYRTPLLLSPDDFSVLKIVPWQIQPGKQKAIMMLMRTVFCDSCYGKPILFEKVDSLRQLSSTWLDLWCLVCDLPMNPCRSTACPSCKYLTISWFLLFVHCQEPNPDDPLNKGWYYLLHMSSGWYSRTPLFQSPAAQEKLFEIAGVSK